MDKNGNFKWYGRVSEEQWEALKKKKLIQRAYRANLKYKYLIGKSHNKHIYELVGRFENIEDVDEFKAKVKAWNESCIIANTSNIRREWIIMKRPDDIDDFHGETFLPDDKGKTVRVKLRSKKWELLERIPHLVDRTFSLLGDNRLSPLRYSFDEACGTFIDVRLYEGEIPLVIYRMKNKIVFYYEKEPIKVLVCSSISEAQQFCYFLHVRYRNNSKVVIFNNITNEKRDSLIDEIVKVTGVSKEKVSDCRTYA